MFRTAVVLTLGLSFSLAHADLLDRGDGLLYDTSSDVTWDTSFTPVSGDREFAVNLSPLSLNGQGGIPVNTGAPYRGLTTWRAPTLSDWQSFATQVSSDQLTGFPTDMNYWTTETTSGPAPIPYAVLFDIVGKAAVYGTPVYLASAYFTPVITGDVVVAVPEPATNLLMVMGAGLVCLTTRRRHAHSPQAAIGA